MKKQKLLIVEDDDVLREVLVEKMRQSGYEVDEAENGEIGLMKIKENSPDLVLLDILMPIKNGMQVLEEMSESDTLSKIPVIIISNSGQPVEVEKATALGARDFLIKAVFDPAEVLEKVVGILGDNTSK